MLTIKCAWWFNKTFTFGLQSCLVLSAARIKSLTGVSIRIPPDNSKDDIIRIEGSPEGVARAKQELIDLVEKMVIMSFWRHVFSIVAD